MNNISSSGNRNIVLDNNLIISSESVGTQTVVSVDDVNNRVGINTLTPNVDLDISGSVAISSNLTVQTNALIVNSTGVGIGGSPSNAFQVTGNVNITGSFYAAGSVFSANTSTLDITSSSIILNQGGTDTTASGAGLIIHRSPSANATLSWNNTKSNFDAGVVGSTTSIIRAGGNSDGAAITIGASDNHTFTVKSGGTNAIQVDTSGNVTMFQNLSLSGTGDILVQGVSVAGAALPPGTVIAFAPGYFTNTSNGGFTATLGTNSVASLNSWLSSNGYGHWVVCDGSSYNIAGSPIFNGASRFTPNLAPNLTNERFLAGSTLVGTSGGTNTFTHAHVFDTQLASTDINHSHVTDQQTGLPNDTATLTSFPGASGPTSAFSFSQTSSFPHSHTYGPHSHGDSTIFAALSFQNSTNLLVQLSGNTFPSGGGTSYQIGTRLPTPSSSASNSTVNAGGFGSVNTGNAGPGSLPSVSLPTSPHTHTYPHSHDITHTHTLPGAVHNHGVTPHTHPSSLAPFASNTFSHTHGPGGQIDNNTTVDNRPQYLTCFYLIKTQ